MSKSPREKINTQIDDKHLDGLRSIEIFASQPDILILKLFQLLFFLLLAMELYIYM